MRFRISLSSLFLFPSKNINIGVKHFINETSDLLSALENNVDADKVTMLIQNGMNNIPISNLTESQKEIFKEKANEWNQNQSDTQLLINTENQQICREDSSGQVLYVVPSTSWSVKASYEEMGPVTGVRVWRTNV